MATIVVVVAIALVAAVRPSARRRAGAAISKLGLRCMRSVAQRRGRRYAPIGRASDSMWDRIWDLWRWTIVRINNFETEHWVISFAILLTIGFLCMQGLGSRKAH